MPPWTQVRHPHLYEIHTRVLLNSLTTPGKRKKVLLGDIPKSYWQQLADMGIRWVWLMGVWTLKEKAINPDLIPNNMLEEFGEILPDFTMDDVDGSPYAIDAYEVDPELGGNKALAKVRKTINNLGMGLMLDFVPNHFGAHTRYLTTHHEYFIQGTETQLNADPVTFYRPLHRNDSIFAQGKDPYFDAWQDTVQVNYGQSEARQFMCGQLLKIADSCDGVRCDMAMLAVRRIFEKTWGEYVSWQGDEEFWPGAIATVKEAFPDCLMLAEVYWGMETELLEMGFDCCYDKIFYDRLTAPQALREHFQADRKFLSRTARFLENHDEERVASRLSLEQHMAAASLVAFGPGMRFWHHGQWEGKRVRLPVQLNRAPEEHEQNLLGADLGIRENGGAIGTLYRGLFRLANKPIFHYGKWERIEAQSAVILWKWIFGRNKIIAAINYSAHPHAIGEIPGLDDMELVFPEGPRSSDVKVIWPWGLCIWQGEFAEV